MEIIIVYQGLTRKVAGVGSERINVLQGATIREVSERVAAKHGNDMRRLLFTADGRLGGDILMAVNDRDLHDRELVVLREGDVLSVAHGCEAMR